MFDWTLSLGNLLTVLILGIGALGFIYTLRDRVDSITNRVGGMEMQLKKLVDILIQQGRQEERLNAFDLRLANQGQRLDELLTRFNARQDREC